VRPAALVLGLAAVVGWAGAAHAGRVDVSSITDASLARIETVRPKALGGKEKVEEVRWYPGDSEEGRALQLVPAGDVGCMFRGDDPPPAVANPDDPSSQNEPPVLAALPVDGPGPRVRSFRYEAVVGEGDGATLAVSRGWYDRQSLGVRLIDKVEIPLTVLSKSPAVYAYRDGATLDIVVPAAGLTDLATRDVEGRLRSFACQHARVAVPLDVASGTAIITARVLPPPTASPGPMLPGKGRRSVEGQTKVQLSLSVTRTSRDVEPWVSLAVGILR